MPFRSAGIAVLRGGYRWARKEKKMHHEETKANCMSVRVIGLGKAFRIDLEEVFVRADDRYHMRHSIYQECQPSSPPFDRAQRPHIQ